MSRVTILTGKGSERVPARTAVRRIESGEAKLDTSDERGVAAFDAYLKVRRTPLELPKPRSTGVSAKKSTKKSTKTER